MTTLNCVIRKKEDLSADTFRLVLFHDEMPIFAPGQFVELKVPGKTLRRPVSLNDQNGKEITLIIREVGEGTRALHGMREGDELSVILPLGNGFILGSEDRAGISFTDSGSGEGLTRPENSKEIILVGGGIGTAPMLYTAKKAKEQGMRVISVLGFKTESETILKNEFEAISDDLYIAYDNRSENVVTLMEKKGLTGRKVLACGPLGMLKALSGISDEDSQYSLEARMGCGFGACMGCSICLKDRMARVCKEGPVFIGKELEWDSLR